MEEKKFQLPVNTLAVLFEAQRSLVEYYTEIENLPKYPLELPMKSSQQILKSFTSRIVIEMTEAYEIITKIFSYVSENNEIKAEEEVRYLNEEIADVTHFILELMIFSGINENNFDDLMEKFLSNAYIKGNISEKGLTAAFTWARDYNNFMGLKLVYKTLGAMRVGNTYLKVSDTIISQNARLMWEVVCDLYKAVNLLKHREWTQSQIKQLNELEYREKLFLSFMSFICYLDFLNINEEVLYFTYMAKNKINHERVATGY